MYKTSSCDKCNHPDPGFLFFHTLFSRLRTINDPDRWIILDFMLKHTAIFRSRTAIFHTRFRKFAHTLSDETLWTIPPLVSKRSETRGELSIMVVFCPKFRLFFTCFGPLGAKKNRLRRHLYTFSRLYVDCGTSSIVLETTTSKCGLSATDENGSEYFRQMMDDL